MVFDESGVCVIPIGNIQELESITLKALGEGLPDIDYLEIGPSLVDMRVV